MHNQTKSDIKTCQKHRYAILFCRSIFWSHKYTVVHLFLINTLRAGLRYIRNWISAWKSSLWLPHQHPSSSADCARELFKSSNGSASLVDCTRKKFFCWWARIFCDWRHKWSSFRVIWLMLPGLGSNR